MKTIRMVFGRADESTHSISLRYAKDSPTETEVTTAMQAVIDNSLVTPAVVSIEGAELIERTVSEII